MKLKFMSLGLNSSRLSTTNTHISRKFLSRKAACCAGFQEEVTNTSGVTAGCGQSTRHLTSYNKTIPNICLFIIANYLKCVAKTAI